MNRDKENFNEDIVTEVLGNDTSVVNVAEIVDKDKAKNAKIPDTVVTELKYLGEEYGGGNIKTNK